MKQQKIKLISSCIVNGLSHPAGWEGQVDIKTAKTLILMGKAESLEVKNMALEMSVSLTPELQNTIDKLEDEFRVREKKVLRENDELEKKIINLAKENVELENQLENMLTDLSACTKLTDYKAVENRYLSS